MVKRTQQNDAVTSFSFDPNNCERIIFFGDSITEQGMGPTGYVTLVHCSLQENLGNRLPEIIGAGVGGNKVPDLRNRLERDVLSKKPSIVIIYIGVNDVWHFATPGRTGTPKNVYEKDLRNIIAKIQAIGSKIILCTPSVIGERSDGTNPHDGVLDEYSNISRKIATETRSALCDLRKDFIEYLNIHNSANTEDGILTVDGVHLNDRGNQFVASKILDVLKR
jgi:isoamyl acetate esterase